MGFGDAVASAGPYARAFCISFQTDNHTNTSSLDFYRHRADTLPDYPTNRVKALKAVIVSTYAIKLNVLFVVLASTKIN